MEIVFATNNLHKLEEVNQISAGRGVTFILPPSGFNPIENGSTFEENSYIKAKEAAILSGKLALADDSGLCVDALNGLPGLYSARYAETQELRIKKLLCELKDINNRAAKFVCCMTLVNPNGEILYQTKGYCYGKITHSPKGLNGFGYDPIFLPDNYNETIAELPEDVKNTISHRFNALKQVLTFLNNNQTISF